MLTSKDDRLNKNIKMLHKALHEDQEISTEACKGLNH